MPTPPLIGITCDVKPEKGGTVFLYHRYIEAVERQGGVPVLIPPLTGIALSAVLKYLAGVVVTGGDDIPPRYYGRSGRSTDCLIEPLRDRSDADLFRQLRKMRLPVFGICYGMQRLCVASGGKLYQHLPKDLPGIHHGRGFHAVEIVPDTVLAEVFRADLIRVPTSHHQGVAVAGKGMRVMGRSADGLIEAVMSEDGRRLGVQWHLERHPRTQALLAHFFRMCKIEKKRYA